MSAVSGSLTITSLPFFYQLFFLYVEPFSTVVGAVYAHFYPQVYLHLTDAASAPAADASVPMATKITLTQLANLYFLFAFLEALVLRRTSDPKVWRTLLCGMLLADLGHVYSVSPLGFSIYWRFWTWNAIHWGNLGFVYVGALTRTAFLTGVGIKDVSRSAKAQSIVDSGVKEL